jgi:large subunit ribosomal protein L25
MSATQTLVKAELRSPGLQSDLSKLRNEGNIPGILYGEGKEAIPVSVNEHDFMMMLKHHQGENLMLDVQIGDEAPRHALLKQVQHHPISARILHVDFHEIGMNRKVKVHLPLNLVGTPVGVSKTGGTLDIQFRELEVECKAADLIEELDVDVSGLAIGDHLTADQVTLPADFRLITPGHVSIATVLKPRVGGTDTEEASSEGAGEPEVIGEKDEAAED